MQSKRPDFLTDPGTWMRTRRIDQSSADYASPITRYKHERSWLASDIVIAAILGGVVLWFCFGGLT